MKLFLITSAAITLGACTYQPPQCGPTEAVVISYTKGGFPIYDDQSPILPPCGVSTYGQPDKPEPPAHEPPETPEKGNNGWGNNGWGNGDQDAPGNSEHHNNAENNGGNHNGQNEAPGRSWYDR